MNIIIIIGMWVFAALVSLVLSNSKMIKESDRRQAYWAKFEDHK